MTACIPLYAAAAEPSHQRSETEKAFVRDEDPRITFWDDKGSLAFLVELKYAYTDVADPGDRQSGNQYDFFVDTVEFDLNLALTDALRVQVVAGVENLGKKDDRADTFLDDAVLILDNPEWPLYFIGGKRTQPFGVFENHLISGTITEDLYEIVEVGGTIGFRLADDWLDLSFTVYQGPAVIENLNDFDAHEFSEDRREKNDEEAYITSLRLEPFENLVTFSAFYQNEPGDDRRNQSIGGALTIEALGLILDAEYIRALSRERGDDDEENKESAWFLGLAFRPIDSLELAVRYEVFDKDRSGDQDNVVDIRYLAGFNYDLTHYTTLQLEYRHTEFEREQGSEAAGHQNEAQLQLAIEF
jgi:hypothetical protein